MQHYRTQTKSLYILHEAAYSQPFGAKHYHFVTGSVMLKMQDTAYWWQQIMASLIQSSFKFRSSTDDTGYLIPAAKC